MMDDENIVSVILRDTSGLVLGDSYRFCLVLLQEKNIKRDLVVGCSNITKLQAIENEEQLSASGQQQLQKLITNTRNSDRLAASADEHSVEATVDSDISMFDRISGRNDEITNPRKDDDEFSGSGTISKNAKTQHPVELFGSLNRSFLPGLGLGILITSLFVLMWGATKLKANRQENPNVSTCYTASSGQIASAHDNENRNRYLKLQATTSL